ARGRSGSRRKDKDGAGPGRPGSGGCKFSPECVSNRAAWSFLLALNRRRFPRPPPAWHRARPWFRAARPRAAPASARRTAPARSARRPRGRGIRAGRRAPPRRPRTDAARLPGAGADTSSARLRARRRNEADGARRAQAEMRAGSAGPCRSVKFYGARRRSAFPPALVSLDSLDFPSLSPGLSTLGAPANRSRTQGARRRAWNRSGAAGSEIQRGLKDVSARPGKRRRRKFARRAAARRRAREFHGDFHGACRVPAEIGKIFLRSGEENDSFAPGRRPMASRQADSRARIGTLAPVPQSEGAAGEKREAETEEHEKCEEPPIQFRQDQQITRVREIQTARPSQKSRSGPDPPSRAPLSPASSGVFPLDAQSNPSAAAMQMPAESARVWSMPMTLAAAPMPRPPSDQRPMSMKNRLSTRPRRCGGVSTRIAVFEAARPATWQPPTRASASSEKAKECEKVNSPRKSPKPATQQQIQRIPGRKRRVE